MTYIVPFLKTPVTTGMPFWKQRIGPDFLQDWYAILRKTQSRAEDLGDPGDEILVCVVSENEFGGKPETEAYVDVLRELGMEDYTVVIPRGRETIEQMQAALDKGKSGDEFIFISSLLHWPRIWWLSRKHKHVTRYIAWLGLPMPYEAVTDIILAIAFPVIDLFGGRDWFLRRTVGRRAQGLL